MNFNETKPIYLQITDYIYDRIISNLLREGDRIPSIRELGGELEVNPNTVMRSYEWLSERKIIFNRRGVGFFICDGARELIIKHRKEELVERELKTIAQTMIQLDVSIEEINSSLKTHLIALKGDV